MQKFRWTAAGDIRQISDACPFRLTVRMRHTFAFIMSCPDCSTSHATQIPTLSDITLLSKAQADHKLVEDPGDVLDLIVLVDGRRGREAVAGERGDDDAVGHGGGVGVERFEMGEEGDEFEKGAWI